MEYKSKIVKDAKYFYVILVLKDILHQEMLEEAFCEGLK